MPKCNPYSFEGVLEKAFWITQHLLAGGYITREKLMDKFEMSDPSARRWIAAASNKLPIIEIDKVVSERSGYSVQTFCLMK